MDELEALRRLYGNRQMLEMWESVKPKSYMPKKIKKKFIVYGTRDSHSRL